MVYSPVLWSAGENRRCGDFAGESRRCGDFAGDFAGESHRCGNSLPKVVDRVGAVYFPAVFGPFLNPSAVAVRCGFWPKYHTRKNRTAVNLKNRNDRKMTQLDD